MLVIRLRRIGRKHDPHYRIVVAEHTSPVQGKFNAEIGHFHPKSKEFVIDAAAMQEWMSKGAKPSNTVAKLANRNKVTKEALPVKEYQGKPKAKAQLRRETVGAPTASVGGSESETPAEETVAEEATEAPAEEVTETPEAEAETSEEATESETPAEETPEEPSEEKTEE